MNPARRVAWACVCGLLAQVPSAVGAAQGRAADARPAAELADSLGVNTHMGAPDKGPEGLGYGNLELIRRELAFIGARHVRDALLIGPGIARLEALHQQPGVRFLLAYDDYSRTAGPARLHTALADVAARGDLVEGIEGPNEPDQFGLHYKGLSGALAVQALQTELYRSVKADPRLKDVPVYCPALSFPAPGGLADQLGNLAPACDVASAHVYVENHSLGAQLTYDYVSRWSALPAAFVPGRPRVITEGGWLVAPDHVDGVDEATQARYILTFLLDAFAQGIPRTYLYDLSDSDSERFGLFRQDGTPKPAATVLSRLQVLLRSGGDRRAAPELLYAVDGLPENGHHLLLRRDDGVLILALWREATLWDRATHAPVRVAPVRVSVRLEGAPRRVEVVDIVTGSGAGTVPYGPGQDVAVDLPAYPVFLLLR